MERPCRLFLAYQTRCRSIGVEYDERIYNKAIENKEKAISAGRIAFKAENAEYFSVPREVDRIYFFNPFSLEILQKVIHRILESYYEKPRDKTTVLLSVGWIYFLFNDRRWIYVWRRNRLQRFISGKWYERADCDIWIINTSIRKWYYLSIIFGNEIAAFLISFSYNIIAMSKIIAGIYLLYDFITLILYTLILFL